MSILFVRLADHIGVMPALTLCAWHGGPPCSLYVPECYKPGHMIERVIGTEPFLRLIAAYGGESVPLPLMQMKEVRIIGEVQRMSKQGMTAAEIAKATGYTYRNVRRLQVDIQKGAPLTRIARESQPKKETGTL